MPSNQALKTGEYCGQCGKDTPANRLFILYSKQAPSGLFPNPDWQRVGRYCDQCLPGEKEMERKLNSAAEFKTEAFTPYRIEGGNIQTRK
jgi:hypothetical protein